MSFVSGFLCAHAILKVDVINWVLFFLDTLYATILRENKSKITQV